MIENSGGAWANARPVTKAAMVLFVIGKFMFIPSAVFTMMMYAMPSAKIYAIVSISLYAGFVFSSMVLSMIGMSQIKTEMRKERQPPSRAEVEKWMKHYELSH
jgi:putative effector of murein hydrolase LrgA (UPF0299 family)